MPYHLRPGGEEIRENMRSLKAASREKKRGKTWESSLFTREKEEKGDPDAARSHLSFRSKGRPRKNDTRPEHRKKKKKEGGGVPRVNSSSAHFTYIRGKGKKGGGSLLPEKKEGRKKCSRAIPPRSGNRGREEEEGKTNPTICCFSIKGGKDRGREKERSCNQTTKTGNLGEEPLTYPDPQKRGK